jgi:uncharacterized protein YukE
MLESIDATVSIVVGLIAVLAALKSAWNGTLRRVYSNITQIEEINSSMNEVQSKQNEIGEAIAVLSWAQEGAIDGVNPRAIEQRVGVERRMSDMIDDDNFYQDRAPPGEHPETRHESDQSSEHSDCSAEGDDTRAAND